MAKINCSPAKYVLEMDEQEALALANLTSLHPGTMLRVIRKEMGNDIVRPQCDEGLLSLFNSCRCSDDFNKLKIKLDHHQ